MLQQKKVSLNQALWEEWGKKGNSMRFQMLELQNDIDFIKQCITYHEKLETQYRLKEGEVELNKNIISQLKSNLKSLLQRASIL